MAVHYAQVTMQVARCYRQHLAEKTFPVSQMHVMRQTLACCKNAHKMLMGWSACRGCLQKAVSFSSLNGARMVGFTSWGWTIQFGDTLETLLSSKQRLFVLVLSALKAE